MPYHCWQALLLPPPQVVKIPKILIDIKELVSNKDLMWISSYELPFFLPKCICPIPSPLHSAFAFYPLPSSVMHSTSLLGHSCGPLIWGTRMRHSYEPLWWPLLGSWTSEANLTAPAVCLPSSHVLFNSKFDCNNLHSLAAITSPLKLN